MKRNGQESISPMRRVEAGSWQIWAKTLKNGQAALIINVAGSSSTITLKLSDLGFTSSQKLTVRDIWEHKDLGILSGDASMSFTLAAHDSKFISFVS